MSLALLVLGLGAAGAVMRVLTARSLPPLFGTLAVNVVAAFLLGLSTRWVGVWVDGLRIGLLGAASTWSTLADEVASHVRNGRRALAGCYLSASLVAGVLAAWVGLQLA